MPKFLGFLSENRLVCFLFALLLLVSAFLRMQYMWVQPLGYDQRTNLMFATLANKGYLPYEEIFIGIPPFSLWITQLGIALAGLTFEARYPVIVVSLSGIIGLFFFFNPAQRYLGLWAAFLLSFNLVYFDLSVSLISEVPAIALAILSLTIARYASQRISWLILSGLLFGISLGFKVFVVFIPLSLFVMLFYQTRSVTATVSSMGVWLVGVGLLLLAIGTQYDYEKMYHQVIQFRLDVRNAYLPASGFLADNLWELLDILAQPSHLLMVGGAIITLARNYKTVRLSVIVWGSWLIFSLIILASHAPLRSRYAILFVPALAALNGILITDLLNYFQHKLSGNLIKLFLQLIIIGSYLFLPFQQAYRQPVNDFFLDQNIQAIQYVWKNTLEDDCLIADDPRFLFGTNRLALPTLAETSRSRINAGWLTTGIIIEQLEKFDCPMVIFTDDIFATMLPDLTNQLEKLFYLTIVFDKNVAVYVAQKNITRQPSLPLQEAIFEDIVQLKGVDLTPWPWHTGQSVRLASYWYTLKPPHQAYKIFIQLRNKDDQLISSYDQFPFPKPQNNHYLMLNIDITTYQFIDPHNYPKQGMVPTNAWQKDHLIRPVTDMVLPENLPRGQYFLYMGLYNPQTDERLLLSDGLADEILVTEVDIR